jgi:hypothetical protein
MKTYQQICKEVIKSFWLVPRKFRQIIQKVSNISMPSYDDHIYVNTMIKNSFTHFYDNAIKRQDSKLLKRICRCFRDNPELLDIFKEEPPCRVRRYFEELQEYESNGWEKERMFCLSDFLFTRGYDSVIEKEANNLLDQAIGPYRISYASILEAKKLYIKGNISIELFYEKVALYMINQMFYLGTEFKYPNNSPNLTYLIRYKKHYIRAFSRQTLVELSALRIGYQHLRKREEGTPGFKKTYFNLLKEILEESLSIPSTGSCRGVPSYPSEWFSDYSFLFKETCYACLETDHAQVKVFKPCNHFVCITCSSNPQCNLIRCGMCRQPIRYIVNV